MPFKSIRVHCQQSLRVAPGGSVDGPGQGDHQRVGEGFREIAALVTAQVFGDGLPPGAALQIAFGKEGDSVIRRDVFDPDNGSGGQWAPTADHVIVLSGPRGHDQTGKGRTDPVQFVERLVQRCPREFVQTIEDGEDSLLTHQVPGPAGVVLVDAPRDPLVQRFAHVPGWQCQQDRNRIVGFPQINGIDHEQGHQA
ncbi:hypothetical protein ABZ749_23015 [Micromonospora sp. NPDC047753]|uniref:hypothetical protein n=1 Tax=Micromonospora sp. NPDC047753 TaxID=3154817 RepID=UPI0033EC2698